MRLTHDQQLALAGLAGRAPSPHNIQPARWRFGESSVELWEDPRRWLAIGDPAGRDNQVALGMAWEGMCLALSELGLALRLEAGARPRLDYPPLGDASRMVAGGTLLPGAVPDPLAGALEQRRSYRGAFRMASPQELQGLAGVLTDHAEIVLPLAAGLSTQVASWYDAAAAAGLDDPRFAAELYRWMRFAKTDPDWSRDGLAADCLALSGIEAWGASLALKPAVVKWLARVSLTPLLVSEASKVKTAARLVVLHYAQDEPAFEAGRAWYRFWLALTLAGWMGVPMSALGDSPAHQSALLTAAPLPPGRRLLNVMRLGPADAAARSARLPPTELLLA